MKRLTILCGITVCFAASLSAQNSPGDSRAGARVVTVTGQAPAKNTAPARSDKRSVYYITSIGVTGSHIPLIVRRYRGSNTAMFHSSPSSGYTAGDIGVTGSLNVGGALLTADPAISSAGSFASYGANGR